MAEGGKPMVVAPGELLTENAKDWLHGKGTYVLNKDVLTGGSSEEKGSNLYSSLCGQIHTDSKLLRVVPPKGRYVGNTGDCVVGRVSQIGAGKWRVDIGAHLDASLLIKNVNLPGGHLRRKTSEDVKQMRSFFQEGDLLSAEIQKVNHDGSSSLHTRSQRYGRLEQGVLVAVPPTLVRRLRSHFHSFDCGISAIVGVNGWVWLHKTPQGGYGEPVAKRRRAGAGGSESDSDSEAPQRPGMQGEKMAEERQITHLPPTADDRHNIARYRAAVQLLAAGHLEISPLTITDVVRASEDQSLRPPDMLLPEHRETLLQGAAERARAGGAMHRTRKRKRDADA